MTGANWKAAAKKSLLLIVSILAAMAQSGCKSASFLHQQNNQQHEAGTSQYLNRADTIAQTLFKIQQPGNNLWRRAGWWNSANILEAMIDFSRLSKSNSKKNFSNVYRKNVRLKRGNFLSIHAFDDNEWWALAWLKAYDLTGDKRYLKPAHRIFRDMIHRSWDTVCGGGVRWAADGEYKNAVTNELFMELAARLALESKDSSEKKYYLRWALSDWTWLKNSGMINNHSMINDGLNKKCVNNKGFTWTYNQGVILGALKNIYLITADSSYLLEAKNLAYASMQNLADKNGILTEPGGRKPGGDKNQFKGIYIRYLALLNTVLKDTTIKNFILTNANYAWQHARSADNFIDFNWSGPYSDWSGSAQGSALDLMNAALMQQ
jgi:predicted alpha-1,6-mannanase (GH76 family)